MADALSWVLASLSLLFGLEAAGVPLFLLTATDAESASLRAPVRRIGVLSAVAGALTSLLHLALQPARMGGELIGLFDLSLQRLAFESSSGSSLWATLSGAVLLCLGLSRGNSAGDRWALVGVFLSILALPLSGHAATSDHPGRLQSLLALHALCVAFWLGSLRPLILAAGRLPPLSAGRIVGAFSQAALLPVGIILPVAGAALALGLLGSLDQLVRPYGLLIMSKAAGFAMLMVLAALNRWRLGPHLAAGSVSAARFLRRTATAEWVLIAAVLAVTALMTEQFSPH